MRSELTLIASLRDWRARGGDRRSYCSSYYQGQQPVLLSGSSATIGSQLIGGRYYRLSSLAPQELNEAQLKLCLASCEGCELCYAREEELRLKES